MKINNTLAFMQSMATFSLMFSLSFAYLINPLEDSLLFNILDDFSSNVMFTKVMLSMN